MDAVLHVYREADDPWNLALNARILREALSTRITVGFAVAFVYLVILWQITERMVH